MSAIAVPAGAPVASRSRGAVDAEVVLAAVADGTRTRLVTTRSAFPVAIRRTGPHRVHLVGTGAWPLGGDRVRIRIEVGPGADLEVATVAASVALPGRSGAPSHTEVTAVVAVGGNLRLDLGSTIVATGADHHMAMDVQLEGDAEILLRELVIRGREGEVGGSNQQRLDVTRDGLAVVREHATRPDVQAPSLTDGGARAVGSVVHVGSRSPRSATTDHLDVAPGATHPARPTRRGSDGLRAVAMSLAGGGWRAVALGDDVAAVDRWLSSAWAAG